MKDRVLILASLCLSVAPLCLAQSSTSPVAVPSTPAEERQLMRHAHTPEQYRSLATYFRQLQTASLAKAAAQKLIWDDRAKDISAPAHKYPRPVDSAHYLYDSYTYDASRYGKLAARYEQLATPPSAAPHP